LVRRQGRTFGRKTRDGEITRRLSGRQRVGK
jgi:hypothetical protein